MTNQEHIDQTVKVTDSDATFAICPKLLHGAVGVSTEAGEILSIAKAHWRYNRPLDRQKLIKELGDLRWYYNLILVSLNMTDEEILDANAAKLKARYTNGFTTDEANKKDRG